MLRTSITIALFLLLPTLLQAQGLYLNAEGKSKEELLTPPSQSPVQLTNRRVHAEIIEAGVTVLVTETFHNSSKRVLEGTYVFPLPKDAAATGITLSANGVEMVGDILPSERARDIYRSIVQRSRDPGLLEYIGQGLLRASIFPIPPHGDVTVKLRYVSTVRRSGSFHHFNFPMKSSATGEPDTLIQVNVRSDLPVRNLYCPTHDVGIARPDDHKATVTYEGREGARNNFHLYYSINGNELGFSLLTHRSALGENFFMLMASPLQETKRVIPKDVIFLLDRSGSMKGEKWEQAKKAVKFCIGRLSTADRFGVVTFATEPYCFMPKLVSAYYNEKRQAAAFLDNVVPVGGTDMHGAIMEALSMLKGSDRLAMVALLTDGLPSVGVTDNEKILKDVARANRAKLRIFNFGVGHDVNTFLLDSLAARTRGTTEYIEEGEDIERKISDYYTKISHPVLSDVELSFHGVEVIEVQPKKMGDLFAGSALVVTGKFKGQGPGEIVMTGMMSGKGQSFSFPADFDTQGDANDFLPSYWAMRKTGYLLNQIRLNGFDEEIKNEIVHIGKRYGIVTPYTSSLAVEEGERLSQASGVPVRRAGPAGGSSFLGGRGRRGEASAGGDINQPPSTANGPSSPAGPGGATAWAGKRAAPSGKSAVRAARTMNEMARKGRLAKDRNVVNVGALSFYLTGDRYVDSRFTEAMKKKLIRVEAYSEEYFDLLTTHGELGKIFALGNRIIFLLDGKAFEIYPASQKSDSHP